ncbi:MAG: hypothetical protein IKO85_05290 [Bacteroidaceae bacterium]|nr:hypothetical protein [Bacteroidaceae bacterium]
MTRNQILRGPSWLTWLPVALLVWLMPEMAAATHVDQAYNYMVMLNGSNTIRIQVPVYDQAGADCWVSDGKLNVSWTDDSGTSRSTTAFRWWRNGETDQSSKDIYVHFLTSVGGSFDVTQGNSTNHFTLTQGGGEQERLVYRNTDGKTYNVYAVWTLPYDMLGKTLKFTWDVERDGNSRYKEKVPGLSDVTLSVPAAADVVFPQVTMATIAYSEQGMLEIPWFIGTTKLTAARYEYTDADGHVVSQTLPANENSGTIYLDATVPHNNFHVIVSYQDGSYSIDNISSKTQNLKMIHAPMGFTAMPLGGNKAKVQLAWNIQYPGTEDMLETDFFEIQRSLTGREEDFVSIGVEAFVLNPDKMSYTYIDSTLVDAISEAQLEGGGTLPNLTYRVRRMCSQNWGWSGNPAAATASCVVDDLHLLRIARYTAQWEDERAYTVRVSWDYADESNAVWTTGAAMKLRITMTNRQGETVDSLIYTLTADERDARQKVVNLTRPCVDYKVELYVERGTSPIRLWEELESYYFPIRSEADWQAFCQKVKDAQGRYDVNVRLYADVSTAVSAGGDTYPFRGIFDGNGHTLQMDIHSSNSFEAPFRYAKDYTIRNLRVTGTVSGGIHSAGLVAHSHATNGHRNTITGCRISATVNCSDRYVGGLIGHGHSANHDITNSLFDGKLTSTASDAYGGVIVGWEDGENENCITNCLEKGSYQGIANIDLCYVDDKSGSGKGIAYNNSGSNRNNWSFYGWGGDNCIIISNAADWDFFCEAVYTADGKRDVNAVLYNDISITTNRCVGTKNKPYRGTFDGNGHTLHINIDTRNYLYGGVFSAIAGATFQNLHVTGTITGYKESGGLVGYVSGSTTNYIKNCRVSASVKASGISYYVGGFVGCSYSTSQLYITDCLFDGQFSAESFYQPYCGAFIGYGSGEWILERNYENGTAPGMNHFGMCFRSGYSAWGGNASNYSAHGWGEMATDANRNLTDQAVAVELLGSQWELKDGKAVPVMATDVLQELSVESLLATLGGGWKEENDTIIPLTPMFSYAAATYPPPTLPNFYHESTGKIDKTLKTATRQSSVLLTWTTDGNPIDYFTVLRRVKGGSDEDWIPVETDIDQLSYEDKTVSPLEDYEYKVRATNDCEGVSYTETNVVEGACKHTGLLEGYVRFNDGTGVCGIDVEIASGDTKVTVTTDESGYFVADELSYNGQRSITYTVTPAATGGIALECEQYAVSFNDHSNHVVVHEFTITNGLQFNAYVMYDGTSIPVKGVRFRVNGQLLHNAKGEYVETDFEGHVQFYVMNNTRSRIQTEMEGHTFVDGGWYKSPDGVVLTDKVGRAYFYDATLVKLTGRVVGGNDQGNLPLDNNLSKNNLGDDLTMVLTLEGDNTSWLVYDNVNPALTTRNLTFQHPGGGDHKTAVEVQRKRMVVKPDSVTGEYVLMLPPARWKVQQIYCEGYATLFQDGQVSEVIDLSECLVPDTVAYEGTFTDAEGHSVYQPQETYHYRYDRIYHAPVEITYRQAGYDTFDYFGDKSYVAQTVGGDRAEVPLVYQSGDTVCYTFGYPVFSLERRYAIQLSVVERYPWNGVKGSAKADVVRIGGGKVIVHNGMKNGLHQETVQLDSVGEGRFILEAEQTTRLLTGEDALRTVTMTLEQDGTTYEAQPLKGYILNMFATGGSKDVLVNGQPLLIDILRDPPGGSSSATLSKGSTLKYTYTLDMKLRAGLHLNIVTGSKLDNFQGTVATAAGAGSVAGIINSNDNQELIDFEYAFNMEGHRAFSYTMNVNQDITTSNEATMVGADADLYIGMVQNMVVTPMSTIRAIPDSLYRQMLGRLGGGQTAGIHSEYGTLVEIAEGRDAAGNKFHLVRDESIGYGPKVESQFVHSQKYILTQLIPEKVRELRNLMFTGTRDEAQRRADATGRPVYWSKVDADNEQFGVDYEMVKPTGVTTDFSDEAGEIHQIIFAWVQMVAQNEHEKLNATELVTNYDVDGGTRVTYSEAFGSDYTLSNYYYLPGILAATYFDESGKDMAITATSIVGVKVVQFILNAIYHNHVNESTTTSGTSADPESQGGFETAVNFCGSTFKFSLLPVMEYSVKDLSGESKSFSRKESFSIVMDKRSHLNFDLYRVQTDAASVQAAGLLDVFTNQNFYDGVEYVEEHLRRGNSLPDIRYSRGYVYRTRGGATCNPWEDERRTLFYDEGRILDERTKKIQNPKITLDRQSVSGVAVGDPARFKVYLANDSELPEASTGSLCLYNLFLEEGSNPHGAKIYVDGTPLGSAGIHVYLNPGQVVQKTIEVYAGDEFDYEGLQLALYSPNDRAHVYDVVSFDVHYLRMAGAVNIASPGDKWIMNTDAPWNDRLGWFLPITIDGFDKHQKNFDHIEFQYKESQRGEEYWTNLCSFYADSTLMAQANGVREMIPENGNINTQFYGEGTVMEKSYDLRAVLCCRDGNSLLTSASKVISGVKDTRRPQLFGSPDPVSGIVKQGEDIVFNFSEDIEYNYLNAITNFEVKGEVNNDNVVETVSVQFMEQASVESEAQRNFSGKDLTIDLMVRPDETGREMPLFSHGTNGKKLQLWLTDDLRLKGVVDDQTFTSTEPIEKDCFTQVAMSISQEDGTLAFYNGGKEIGMFELTEPYNGTGTLIFGRTNETDRSKSHYYQGRMMEARLWYRALTGAQIGTTYGSKRLTGYEMGLVDYYPMNEGSGQYVMDHTQGANARLMGASWAMPHGLALHLDGEEPGLALTQNALNRTAEQDYTLMFWFKTDDEGRGVLVSNGAGSKNEVGAENLFNIGFETGKLMYRSNGMDVEVPGNYSDGQWHHYAMTVNRAFNVVNIYVDQELRTTFAADSLGGISGGHPLIGAALMDRVNDEGHVLTTDTRQWLKGHIDELCFFAQALDVTPIAKAGIVPAAGDRVAAFVGDECRGTWVMDNGQLDAVLTVFGRKEGEHVTLKYYDSTRSRVLTFADVAVTQQGTITLTE